MSGTNRTRTVMNLIKNLGDKMFKFVGKDAVEGAISQIGTRLKGFDMASIASQIPVIGQIMPLWDGIKAGYDSMTPEQKAEMWKNLMIAGAKLAAKA